MASDIAGMYVITRDTLTCVSTVVAHALVIDPVEKKPQLRR